jgi:GNAT superfamily N-acetyltransferase
MSVIPTYRRRGIGSILMASYTNYADANNYECWLEGTPMGKSMYENFGFESLFKIAFDIDTKNASDVWRKCEHELTPPPIYAMWRPKRTDREARNGAEAEDSRRLAVMPWGLRRDDR